VLGERSVTDRVVLVRLGAPDGSALPGWSPGGHIDLVLPNGLVRPYSLCGRQDDRREWRILVRREDESRGGSAYVHDRLRPGDLLGYRGPRAWFRLGAARRYLFLAGGVGIAPLIPMARLLTASHLPWSMGWAGDRNEGAALVAEVPDLAAQIMLTPAGDEGRAVVEPLLDGLEPGTAVYACGSAPFMEAVRRARPEGRDIDLQEQWFGAPAAAGNGDRSVEIELARSGVSFTVPPGISLVTALRRMGVVVPVSCGAGICGACLVPVLDGVPEHRDRVLSGRRRARGDAIITCVSRARSSRLVLDL
jgi:ferredoxin-NADP reductase